MNAARRRTAHRPRRSPVQTAEQPVYNAGEHYANSTAATAGAAVARDARIAQENTISQRPAEQEEIASTLTAVLGVLGVLVVLTAVT